MESNDGSPSLYNQVLTGELRSRNPTNLCDLEKAIVQTKKECDDDDQQQQTQSETKQPWQHPEIQLLIQQRKTASTNEERKTISKKMQKKTRQFLRRKRNQRTEQILTEFRDLNRLHGHSLNWTRVNGSLDDKAPTQQEFAHWLGNIFFF